MNKAFEKIIERIDKEIPVYTGKAKQIVREVAEEYNGGWILCTIVDHPDNDDDCEVTMLEHGEYIREIGFYTDRWRRASDEAAIEVVAWKEPSTPYQPK